jgi:TonB family protein
VDLSLVREAESARTAAMSGILVLLLAAASSASTVPPRVIEAVEAEVPAWARGAGLSTRVPLRVLVGRDGRASRVEVVPYSTRNDILTRDLRAGFDSAAVRAVRTWRFEPARRGGSPVAAWLPVEVTVAEPWARGTAAAPDSVREPGLWTALLGEWRRISTGNPSHDRVTVVEFRRDGRYVERVAGTAREGRFEIASSGGDDVRLTRVRERVQRIERMRFAGRDTLILYAPGTPGFCDTFLAVPGSGR